MNCTLKYSWLLSACLRWPNNHTRVNTHSQKTTGRPAAPYAAPAAYIKFLPLPEVLLVLRPLERNIRLNDLAAQSLQHISRTLMPASLNAQQDNFSIGAPPHQCNLLFHQCSMAMPQYVPHRTQHLCLAHCKCILCAYSPTVAACCGQPSSTASL